MTWQKELSRAIQVDFQRRKERNSRFSLRQYAKKIGLSVGATSEVLQGKRHLAVDRAFEIVEKLEIGDSEKNRLQLLMGRAPRFLGAPQAPNPRLTRMAADWRRFVILSTLSEDAEPSPTRLDLAARHLGLDVTEVRAELETLRTNGFLETSPRLAFCEWSTWNAADEAAKKLKKSRQDFQSRTAPESCELLAPLLVCRPERLEELKRELSRILMKFAIDGGETETLTAEGQKMYQMFIAITPITEDRDEPVTLDR